MKIFYLKFCSHIKKKGPKNFLTELYFIGCKFLCDLDFCLKHSWASNKVAGEVVVQSKLLNLQAVLIFRDENVLERQKGRKKFISKYSSISKYYSNKHICVLISCKPTQA